MTTEKAQVRQSVPTARITVDERLIEMQVGETKEIKPIVLPLLTAEQAKSISGDAAASALLSMLVTDKIEYASSNPEIATVDENGIVTAKKEGSCKITAKSGSVELVCNILVNVPIDEWASEEFLEYVERIGAYTELPLGTDGSAGPTAQYVTFGWELSYDDFRCFNEIDERTKTTYKDYDYAKADDDEWYWKWGYTCNDTSHDHSQSTMESYTNSRGETVTPAPAAYKITPRKWRLLDKEKGLMVMDNEDTNFRTASTFAAFTQVLSGDDTLYPNYYPYFNKNAIEKMPNIFNYETSMLRASIDGGEYLKYSDFFYVDDKGEFIRDDNGKYKYAKTEAKLSSYNDKYTQFYILQRFCAPCQLAQIKEVDLDCGEGGSVKGRLFILSEDEIKKYYSDGSKLIPWKNWFCTFCTRTRKKINGKNTLCIVTTNYDGTIKEFCQRDEAYTLQYTYDFIPAICVAPAPQE